MPRAQHSGDSGVSYTQLAPRGVRAWPQQACGARTFNPLTERLRRSGVPETALADLEAGQVEIRSIAAGRPIVCEGATSPRLHILLEGWACRYTSVEGGPPDDGLPAAGRHL